MWKILKVGLKEDCFSYILIINTFITVLTIGAE